MEKKVRIKKPLKLKKTKQKGGTLVHEIRFSNVLQFTFGKTLTLKKTRLNIHAEYVTMHFVRHGDKTKFCISSNYIRSKYGSYHCKLKKWIYNICIDKLI